MAPAERDARATLPCVVFGGRGYVAGELLRILSGHPRLRVAGASSTTQAGGSIVETFPHLSGVGFDGATFLRTEDAIEIVRSARGPVGAFLATPHGAAAPLARAVLAAAEEGGATARVVDLSADFRFRDAATFAKVYGAPHEAPELLPHFVGDPPELHREKPPRHAAQPGCFTTCVALAAAPFMTAAFVRKEVLAIATTGSSGAGTTPQKSTHHPERRSNFFMYAPLSHRHEPEMAAILGRVAGAPVEVEFAPSSGPFVRGIHATLKLVADEPIDTSRAVALAREFYADAPFVDVAATPPALASVVGTNRCKIGVVAGGRTLLLTSVLDNLVKGAAGGAVQWMNRLMGFDEDAGLRLPGLGWC
jgi:N-acetyl-gamma-glutamyl-phosphate reductase common form